ncbi:SdpI family protein [Luteimonas vadosa]|uniref:SdpI family protein n=1 Tax=Luteimonas vadosa TaxID=1165507 RepID=UPI003CD07013
MTIHFLASLLLCAIGLVLLLGGLPPNRWFGLRTDRTLANPAAWYRAHRACGWFFLALGVAIFAMSLWPTIPVHPAWGLASVAVTVAAAVLVYRRYAA